MTFREKLEKEHPDKVRTSAIGGCVGCPINYDYEYGVPSSCGCSGSSCTACWDREMPGTEDFKPEWNPPMKEIIDEMNMVKEPEEPKRMTFREKFKQDYPELADKADTVHNEFCPHVVGYEEMPSTCIIAPGDCKACWDREMPEEDEIRKALKKSESSTTIKDSGARREFESGAVRDIQEGKGRCDLLPLDVVAEVIDDSALFYISMFKDTGETIHLVQALCEACMLFNYEDNAEMILEVSKHFEDGAKKYGEYNWQKGMPVHCYIDSAVRHYLKHLRGDVDEYHDRAFVWNILCCIWTCKHKPELNEYKKPETTETNN